MEAILQAYVQGAIVNYVNPSSKTNCQIFGTLSSRPVMVISANHAEPSNTLLCLPLTTRLESYHGYRIYLNSSEDNLNKYSVIQCISPVRLHRKFLHEIIGFAPNQLVKKCIDALMWHLGATDKLPDFYMEDPSTREFYEQGEINIPETIDQAALPEHTGSKIVAANATMRYHAPTRIPDSRAFIQPDPTLLGDMIPSEIRKELDQLGKSESETLAIKTPEQLLQEGKEIKEKLHGERKGPYIVRDLPEDEEPVQLEEVTPKREPQVYDICSDIIPHNRFFMYHTSRRNPPKQKYRVTEDMTDEDAEKHILSLRKSAAMSHNVETAIAANFYIEPSAAPDLQMINLNEFNNEDLFNLYLYRIPIREFQKAYRIATARLVEYTKAIRYSMWRNKNDYIDTHKGGQQVNDMKYPRSYWPMRLMSVEELKTIGINYQKFTAMCPYHKLALDRTVAGLQMMNK